jgi:hypothetical protein
MYLKLSSKIYPRHRCKPREKEGRQAWRGGSQETGWETWCRVQWVMMSAVWTQEIVRTRLRPCDSPVFCPTYIS